MPPEIETHLVNTVLTNGARYYVDHAHPEYSTPECSDALELVSLHYETSKEAARAQLERAEESFADLEPELRVLTPEGAAAAAAAVARVESLVERDAPAAQVVQAAEAAEAAVRRAARLR